jgi:hypothetical protein
LKPLIIPTCFLGDYCWNTQMETILNLGMCSRLAGWRVQSSAWVFHSEVNNT